MPAKPNAKNWNDIKMVITAISVTATLGFWNLFAVNNPKTNTGQDALEPEIQQSNFGTTRHIQVPTPVFTGKILLGGQAPAIASNAPVQQGKAAPRPKQPAARTHSS